MKGQTRVFRRAVQLAAASLAMAGTGVVGGCLNRPIEPVEPKTTSTVVERLTESAVDKIDLVLMIDNSRSMADKQAILVEAVPDLVRGLVNPACVDPEGMLPPQQVNGPLDMCPTGLKRDFPPVLDIHIGIVSSSIGGHGSDACPNSETTSCAGGATNTTNNDMGHLVSRQDSCASSSVPTYQNKGFLAWDPTGMKDTPAGEKNIGQVNIDTATGTVTTVTPGLVPSLKDMVLGTGQIGCGYEASIESWYRFLVDPEPYQTITIDGNGRASPQGIDNVLIQQRTDFLRSSSLLAIIGLTDENDCSVKEYGQFYFVNQQRDPGNQNKNFYLPKPRSECATNPNDKCCVSCGQSTPAGCPADPVCSTGTLDNKTDDVNLRCWDTKRRFGIDFLYPIDRYVTGLTQPLVPNRKGEMVSNPIFSDLNPMDKDSSVRDASLVFLAYITGVPWQDIARKDASGKPNLLTGLDSSKPPKAVGGFKSAAELAAKDAMGHTTWDYIIGDPANYVKPLDPHMIEDWGPRTGTNPITGDTLAPPSKTEGGSDQLNGHEYTTGTKNGVQVAPDDLEYACIFQLPQPRDCSDPSVISCDCSDTLNDNPLCADNGAKGRTLQTHAKGYPGIRQLSLVKALGSQGIVGSICPAQLNNLNGADFGYRPAIGAIIDRLKVALGGQCLPRQLTPNPTTHQVQCLILEARHTGQGLSKQACDDFCNNTMTNPGRQAVDPLHDPAVTAAQADPSAKSADWDCFCEIKQTQDDPKATPPLTDLTDCQNAANPPTTDFGWCYIDATSNPPVGDEKLVAQCPDTEKRLVRFVGQGVPATGATLFITCAGE